MASKRVAILVPMQIEFDPIITKLDLQLVDDTYVGTYRGIELVTFLTNIGMLEARKAAERAVGLDVDLVMVVGICGGLDPDREIGTVIRPLVVADRDRGTQYRPVWAEGVSANGTLSSSNEFVTDPEATEALRRAGVIAVDMETAAVANVCEAAGVPWSVHRSISDRASDGLVDNDIWAFTQPDGSADPDALAKYLRADPRRAVALAQVARDTEIAANAAADDAIALLRSLA